MRTLFSKQLLTKCIIITGFILFLNAGTTAQQDHSLEHWKSIVEQNADDAKAWFNIGVLYETGEGAEKNQTRAHDAYKKSIDLGYAPAMYNLGSIYAKQKDYANARLWWEKAAELDLPEAQYNMGMLYEKGWGVSVDQQLSSSWYQRAAETAMEKYFQLYQKSRSEHLVNPDIGEPSFGILDRVTFIKTASAASTPAKIIGVSQSSSHQPVPDQSVSKQITHQGLQLAQADTGSQSIDQKSIDQKSIDQKSSDQKSSDQTDQNQKRPPDWQWIFSEPAESFTIQLFATKEIDKTGKFIQQYALSERARVIQAVVKGTTYYKVLLGSFIEWNDAAVEIGAFPQDLRNQRPWVRKFNSLYNEFPQEILATAGDNDQTQQVFNTQVIDSADQSTDQQPLTTAPDEVVTQSQAKIEEVTDVAEPISEETDEDTTKPEQPLVENSSNALDKELSDKAISTAQQANKQPDTEIDTTSTSSSQAQTEQSDTDEQVPDKTEDLPLTDDIFTVYALKQLASSGLSAEFKAQLKSGLDAIAADDPETGFAQLKPLAESGLPEAQYRVALLYSRGKGVEQDPGNAFVLMKSASEQGHPYAQQILADYYVKGIGVDANSSLASYWQQTAADNVKKLESQ